MCFKVSGDKSPQGFLLCPCRTRSSLPPGNITTNTWWSYRVRPLTCIYCTYILMINYCIYIHEYIYIYTTCMLYVHVYNIVMLSVVINIYIYIYVAIFYTSFNQSGKLNLPWNMISQSQDLHVPTQTCAKISTWVHFSIAITVQFLMYPSVQIWYCLLRSWIFPTSPSMNTNCVSILVHLNNTKKC